MKEVQDKTSMNKEEIPEEFIIKRILEIAVK